MPAALGLPDTSDAKYGYEVLDPEQISWSRTDHCQYEEFEPFVGSKTDCFPRSGGTCFVIPPPGLTNANGETASEALVKFGQSGFEQRWTPEDVSLLDLAEAHGLTPPFACRSGGCGSCATRLKAGKVVCTTPPASDPGEDMALICSAVPARDTDQIELEL